MSEIKQGDLVSVLTPHDKSLSKKEIFLTNFYCDPKIIGGGQIIFKNLIKKVKPDFIGTTGFKTSMINYHKKLRFNVNTLKHFYLKKNKINKFKYNSENFKLLDKKEIQLYRISKLPRSNLHRDQRGRVCWCNL